MSQFIIDSYNINAVWSWQSGLGNFIHATPAFQQISAKIKRPVKIQFNSKYVADCFQDAPFLQQVSGMDDRAYERKLNPNFCDKNLVDDYEYAWWRMTGTEWKRQFPLYVDTPDLPRILEKEYLVLLNGGSKNEIRDKSPKKLTLEMMEAVLYKAHAKKIPVVFCGNKYDLESIKEVMPDFELYCKVVIDDIRLALSVINGAKAVVANDTGLYHVACAMGKKVFVSTRTITRRNGLPSRCIRSLHDDVTYINDEDWAKMMDNVMTGYEQGYVELQRFL